MIAPLALVAALSPVPPPPHEAETKVIGFDYAFRVAVELPAGRMAFRFENRGKKRQELYVGQGRTADAACVLPPSFSSA